MFRPTGLNVVIGGAAASAALAYQVSWRRPSFVNAIGLKGIGVIFEAVLLCCPDVLRMGRRVFECLAGSSFLHQPGNERCTPWKCRPPIWVIWQPTSACFPIIFQYGTHRRVAFLECAALPSIPLFQRQLNTILFKPPLL